MRNIYIYLVILITIVTGVSVIHAQTTNVQTEGVIGWVKFDAGITNGVTCPDCGPGAPSTLAASCLGTQSSNTSATWSATITGGNAPYTYTWTGGVHTSIFTKTDSTLTNGSTVIAPSLSISSTDGQTVAPICPNVVISVTNNSGAKMWVNNNPLLTITKVRTGHSAKLNWSIVNDFINNGYDTCVGQGGALAGWTGSTITTDKPNYTPYLLPMPTPGNYTLKIKCSMSADPTQYQETNTVNVIVSDSVIEEI